MTRSTTAAVTVLLAACMMNAPGVAFAAEDRPAIDSATPSYKEDAPIVATVPAGTGAMRRAINRVFLSTTRRPASDSSTSCGGATTWY